MSIFYKPANGTVWRFSWAAIAVVLTLGPFVTPASGQVPSGATQSSMAQLPANFDKDDFARDLVGSLDTVCNADNPKQDLTHLVDEYIKDIETSPLYSSNPELGQLHAKLQNVKQNLTKIDNATLKDIGVALSIDSIFKEAWQAVAAVLPQGQINFDNLKAAFESTRFAKSMHAKGNDPTTVESVIDFSLAGNLSEMLLSQAPVVNNPGSKGR